MVDPTALSVISFVARPEWDETWGAIAKTMALRSTCTRRQVGAVIVKDKHVIGMGYNGVASGAVHCIDGGCPRGRMGPEVPPGADYNVWPCYAIHAEHNAILQAGLRECHDSTLYVTDKPCQQCANLIKHAKIGEVIVV